MSKVKKSSNENDNKSGSLHPIIQRRLEANRCPVCNGNGIVPGGFYNQTSGAWIISGTATEICQSCNGSGIVWK